MLNLSPQTVGLDLKRGGFFRVKNAFNLKSDLKNRLTPLSGKLLQPVIVKKELSVYTDYSTAFGLANGNLALVCLDDLLSFISKKNIVDFVLGSQTVHFRLKDLQAEKDYFTAKPDQAKYQS